MHKSSKQRAFDECKHVNIMFHAIELKLSGSLRYCGVSLPVILSEAKNLDLWEQILRFAQNDWYLKSAVTPQYLKEPTFIIITFFLLIRQPV